MTISASAKAFENLKLENYISNINEFAQYVRYLNTFHLLKTECQWKGGRRHIQKTIKKYQELIMTLNIT